MRVQLREAGVRAEGLQRRTEEQAEALKGRCSHPVEIEQLNRIIHNLAKQLKAKEAKQQGQGEHGEQGGSNTEVCARFVVLNRQHLMNN